MVFKSALVGSLALTAALAAGSLTYHVTILKGWGYPACYCCPLGVNNSGQVVGWANAAIGSHAFLYSGGVFEDLGTMGGPGSEAWGVNESGQVAGWSNDAAGNSHAFLYSGGVMTDLGNLGGAGGATAYGINDSGEVVGSSYTADGWLFPFLYSGGVMHNLGSLGGLYSEAYGINDSGQVVGWSLHGGPDEHAFLYSGGGMTDLGTLGGTLSRAWGVNAFGQVVGYSTTISGVEHAFLYSGGVMTDLGAKWGTAQSHANGINDSGQVVVTYYGYIRQILLYSGGVMTDLKTMLDGSGAGCTISEATAIANNGMITGYGTSAGQCGFLLTPNAGVAGTVSLQNYAGDVTQVPVTIEIRNPGTTTVVQKQTVNLNVDGTFLFCTTLAGTYDVAVKAPPWLRKKIASVTLTGTGFTTGMNFSLVNGDVNGDNNINLADATAISLAWRTKPGDAKWNPNADLNGDGTINLADAVIVSKNWRKTGDP